MKDGVIFEEFRGIGNMELLLSRMGKAKTNAEFLATMASGKP